MFNRFAAVLHQAVEAIAPTQSLLEDFVFHWKAITHYFINNKDDKKPVQDSNIPNHLDHMLAILTQEEGQMESNQTGPCMEHLLQHKILETLWTLGKADCPPGMKQMVLSFFTSLLGRIKQPLLPHINVYKPVHKLVKVCGETRAGPTEKEEIQFLCVVCFKLREHPYLVNFFLEDPKQSGSRQRGPSRAKAKVDLSQAEFSVVDSLLKLLQSPDSRIAVKACEGLMLCASLPEPQAAHCIVRNTMLCSQLTQRLCSLYNALPLSMDPVDIDSVEAKWGLDLVSDADDTNNFAGKRQLISLLSWFDYCDQIIKEGHAVIGKALATHIKDNFLVPIIEQLLLQTSEVGILTSTAHLAKFVKMTSSPLLLAEFVYFILGESTSPEKPGEDDHQIRHRLIERCDHLSDEICIMSLKLFEVLLQKSHVHIVNNLVLRNLQSRGYRDRSSSSVPTSPRPSSPSSPSPRQLHSDSEPPDVAADSTLANAPEDLPLTNGPSTIDSGHEIKHEPEHLHERGSSSLTNNIDGLASEVLADDPCEHTPMSLTLPDGQVSVNGNNAGEQRQPTSNLPDSHARPVPSATEAESDSLSLLSGLPESLSLLPPMTSDSASVATVSLTTPIPQPIMVGATPGLAGRGLPSLVPLSASTSSTLTSPTLGTPVQGLRSQPVPISPLSNLLGSPPDLLTTSPYGGTGVPQVSLMAPSTSLSPPLTPGSPASTVGNEDALEVNMHKVASCFLGLIPEENKSSYLTGDTGYDMYLREAHRNFRECSVNCLPYEWPNYPTPLEQCPDSGVFFEGAFIKILFDKLSRMLDQTYEVNLQVTSVLAKIALFPHPHIHEYLLEPYMPVTPGCRTLYSVLEKVVNDLDMRAKSIPEFQKQLVLVRQQLMGMVEEHDMSGASAIMNLPYIDLLEGVIVLEEFCKEMAAVAFVKFHAASGR